MARVHNADNFSLGYCDKLLDDQRYIVSHMYIKLIFEVYLMNDPSICGNWYGIRIHIIDVLLRTTSLEKYVSEKPNDLCTGP